MKNTLMKSHTWKRVRRRTRRACAREGRMIRRRLKRIKGGGKGSIQPLTGCRSAEGGGRTDSPFSLDPRRLTPGSHLSFWDRGLPEKNRSDPPPPQRGKGYGNRKGRGGTAV